MYAPAIGPAVKWRLLSGNNRDMGRGVATHRDVAACRQGILDVLLRLDELDPIFIPEGNNSWRWFLRYNGEPIVSSGHAYDRKVRCKEGQVQFLLHAPNAQIREDVVSSARRWSTAATIDLTDHSVEPGLRIRNFGVTTAVVNTESAALGLPPK
jgi:uncharacterized protein YegP (UPF0339 family)